VHEILSRHVGLRSHRLAIASAMAAMQIAPQRTLPEELLQRMHGDEIVLNEPVQFQRNRFS
jgi:hypothetical protein